MTTREAEALKQYDRVVFNEEIWTRTTTPNGKGSWLTCFYRGAILRFHGLTDDGYLILFERGNRVEVHPALCLTAQQAAGKWTTVLADEPQKI